jgi:aryl-alcohol dehydrogenase-like predicted oxidoreductase/predicted kinase
MRLPPEHARATIASAVAAGITVFDTARAYGHGESVVAGALREVGASTSSRIVTKGGMTRAGGGWVPDGRAKAIRADCETSLAALDGLPIDLYLIHAPDPRTAWRTSVRALARLADEGLVRRVGVSNVNRRLLDEALELAPISAVEVALNPFDVSPLRGGVLERCAELGLTVIAHSPLGGPRRAGSLSRRPELVAVAVRHAVTAAEAALAWLLALAPGLIAVPGARRPETARSAAHAASLALDPDDIAALNAAFGAPSSPLRVPPRAKSDVVLVMGIPGAGKSRLAEGFVDRGYRRLNRDEVGGSLRSLAGSLDDLLAAGGGLIVLDNTYLTRASRSWAVEVAGRRRARVRCVWVDTPLAQAQVNLVERLLDRFGHLPAPEELRTAARREPGLLAPTSQMRAVRELEPPEAVEGFAEIERIEFARDTRPGHGGVFVAAAALRAGWTPAARGGPHLLFDWIPDGDARALADLAARVPAPVEIAVCAHGGGPPACWCRPPLPGLPLAFARVHGVDPARSTLVGTSAAHRTLAAALGAAFVSAA